MNQRILVVIGEAPYTAERPYTAMRFVNTALIDGHTVNLFLIEDGIFTAMKKQNPTEYPNVKQWLEEGLEQGLAVKACGVCMKARGVEEADMVTGVKIASMHELVAWVIECDKSLFF